MLNKSLLGYLSILGEVGPDADPGSVNQKDGDGGGWSYGLYQLSSVAGSVYLFIKWLGRQPEPAATYATRLSHAGNPTCDQEFVDTWEAIATEDPDGFAALQDAYAKEQYYDPAAAILDRGGFDISAHALPLQQVLMANAIQHGPQYGAEAFVDGAQSVGGDLSSMSDADIITALYQNKINDLSWSSGSPDERPGLFARWQNEMDTAIAMLSA